MIHTPAPYDPEAPVALIDIGNSSIKLATWSGGEVQTPISVPTDAAVRFQDALSAHVDAMPHGRAAAFVVASVVPEALDRVRDQIEATMDRIPLVLGENLPLPIAVEVRDAKAIGVDRVCAAAAAFDKIDAACTVIDFGTAVTVDLVNGDGKLMGGAIFAGVSMQLHALEQQTAALPLVEPGVPETPFGRDTQEAIQNGVCRGIAGAARGLVEAYSAHLNHWPHVVATGGDLEWLVPHCDFVDTAVRDLALHGVGIAYTKYLATMGA